MPGVLVIYHSRSGHTEVMARRISDAIRDEGLDVVCKKVEEADIDDLLLVDGVVVGSPTYYGTMAAEVKRFLDESVKYHGKLDGKVGAAFSSANSTGQETTVLSILEALLIHGMIVQGDCQGLHYGVTTVGEQTESQLRHCRRFGQRFARLVKMATTSSTKPNSD
ncbi:MAG: flavodoxin family protein [Dehalococcoidia bacterium]|nr:MAG: flavodoxin family protein [Dehalococcoidia bacterium]